MVSTFRDLISVIDELKGLSKRILEPPSGSLTSIQLQAYQGQLVKDIKENGIEFTVYWDNDDAKCSNIHFRCQPPIAVKGTGTIDDVTAVGHYPIRISFAQDVDVLFEPRDLRKSENHQSIPNSEFAGLKKGNPYEFRGVIGVWGGKYYFKQTPCRFEFFISNEMESKSEGCFVATAAYGSPSPTVFLLQKYRDCVMEKATLGRAAVRLYYKLSPPLARFIQESPRRRRIARVLLRPVSFLARVHLESSRK
jgi:hypothetical protein